MVTGSATYCQNTTFNLPSKSKFFRVFTNDFVLSNIYIDQAYFWTQEWQEGEKEADEDIKKNRVKDFQNAKGIIKHLHSKRK